MPIYEFECTKCNKRFEEIVFGKAKAKCPKCKSTAKKLQSTFSFSGSGIKSSSSCSSCKPSASKCKHCK